MPSTYARAMPKEPRRSVKPRTSGNAAPSSPTRAADTKERLISLAATMFAEEGYASASVRDLAARSGMTSGAIYGNFKGKAGLLVAAVDARLSTDLEDPPSGLDGVTEVTVYHSAHHDERETLRALLLEGAVAARADDEVREHLSETMAPRID